MSRYYSMAVTITGAARERVDAVKQAAEAEWAFDDWFLDDMKQGQGYYVRTNDVSALVPIFDDIANAMPLAIVD